MPTIDSSVAFIQNVFAQTGKTAAVIAVSGGIDSAVALSLLTRALSAKNVYPLLLPHGEQSTSDAREIIRWNAIPDSQARTVNIQPFVDVFGEVLEANSAMAGSTDAADGDESSSSNEISIENSLRLGNIKARCRMIVVFDYAKQLDALVCGTENKSEKHLGYFTRFGDAASDLEPLSQLYKTEVRALARALELPNRFIEKAPSAELWNDQTDEVELGFSYADADRILVELIDHGRTAEELVASGEFAGELVEKVAARVASQRFKQVVPYVVS
jgi:NAD+ synthase